MCRFCSDWANVMKGVPTTAILSFLEVLHIKDYVIQAVPHLLTNQTKMIKMTYLLVTEAVLLPWGNFYHHTDVVLEQTLLWQTPGGKLSFSHFSAKCTLVYIACGEINFRYFQRWDHQITWFRPCLVSSMLGSRSLEATAIH